MSPDYLGSRSAHMCAAIRPHVCRDPLPVSTLKTSLQRVQGVKWSGKASRRFRSTRHQLAGSSGAATRSKCSRSATKATTLLLSAADRGECRDSWPTPCRWGSRLETPGIPPTRLAPRPPSPPPAGHHLKKRRSTFCQKHDVPREPAEVHKLQVLALIG